jgi:fructose-specific phosphotransferase system IIA component
MNLRAKNKREVLEELLDLLVKAGKVKDKQAALAKMIEREEILSTGIGHGVAIPHAITDAVNDILAVFGRSKEGIDYDALDGQPVYLFFLLLSDEKSSSTPRIKILARISRLLKQEYVRETLKKLDSPEEVLELIRKEEARLIP